MQCVTGAINDCIELIVSSKVYFKSQQWLHSVANNIGVSSMKNCVLVLLCLACSFVVSASEPKDPFKKIDPECDVWVASRHTITTQVQTPVFVVLMNVREIGAPRDVALYFPESVNLNDELDDMLDQTMAEKMRETVRRQMTEQQAPIDKWAPIKQVPRYEDDNFAAPTEPGYYWANSVADLDASEDLLRKFRTLVVVARKKNGSLAVMQAGSTYAAPLNEFGRWSRGLSIKSVTGTHKPKGPLPPVKARVAPVSNLPPNLLKNLELAKNGKPQREELPEVPQAEVKKGDWYLVEEHSGKKYAGIAIGDGAYVFESIRTDPEGDYQRFTIHIADTFRVRGPVW